MVARLLAVLVMFSFLQDAPVSLLTNGSALDGGTGWRALTPEAGVAKTETVDGVPCFRVQYPGVFVQIVQVPPTAAGWYVAIVGRGQAVRVKNQGSITGLPYLHATVTNFSRRNFTVVWQEQQLRGRHTDPGEWVPLSGLFRVPEGAAAITLQLAQAQRKGDPQGESAGRLTDVRMVMFPKESAAQKYISAYRKAGDPYRK